MLNYWVQRLKPTIFARSIDLIKSTNEISTKHKNLQHQVETLEKQIEDYNQENQTMNLILNNLPNEENVYPKLTIDIHQSNQQTSILISPNSVEEKHYDCQQSKSNH